VMTGAALLLGIAVLTKTTAFFGLPCMLYLAFRRGTALRERILFTMFTLAVFLLPIIFWTLFTRVHFPQDIALFTASNFTGRIELQPAAIIKNVVDCVRKAFLMEPVALPFGLVSCAVLLIRSRPFRGNVLVHCSLLWIVGYTAILGSTDYQPERYFLPIAVPAAIMFGAALYYIQLRIKSSLFLTLQIAGIIYFCSYNGYKVFRTLTHPSTSFTTMAKEVKQLVDQHGNGGIVMGNFANSVSLASGIRSINTAGTKDIAWKITTYRPKFYLSLGYEPEIIRAIFPFHTMEPLGEWDVFNNYCQEKTVHLFRLGPPATDEGAMSP
jgi:hypothetical protein